MANWRAVITAAIRAEGRGWTEVADLLLTRGIRRSTFAGELGDRVENVFRTWLDEWRAAGVRQPLTLFAVVASANMAVLASGMWRSPHRTLKLVAAACGAGMAYGSATAVARKREHQRPGQAAL